MEDAVRQRDRGDGQALMGPSGAPVWNSPSVDEKRGLIYFGTGESNSPPAHRNTNAIIAIRLSDGKEVWSHQATPRDIFNSGCGLNPPATRLNCVGADETVYRDVDFGASMIVGDLPDGSSLIFAGQKSGSVWALKPETGEVVWRRAIGTGGALGGVHWGIAHDRDTVFVPISSVGRPIPGEWDGTPAYKSGLYALNAKTGEIRWSYTPTPDCANVPEAQRRTCSRGGAFSAAPTVIGDVVVAGTLSETAQEFTTMNGVPGKGGAIDAGSMVAANGLLLVQSGYGMFGQAPGNVLLAFKPKTGKPKAG
jgi:polyvinyl alcohol dehydrogenase (cytochrome)